MRFILLFFSLSAALGFSFTQAHEVLLNHRSIHDPALIADDTQVYAFHTGPGITQRCGRNVAELQSCSRVFFRPPDWHREEVPGVDHLWAPDVIFAEDEYRLYYSVSTFGSNRSAIGLATTSTLNPADDNFAWVDRGPVIQSYPNDNFNAIDPHLFIDDDGRHWLTFGSFWNGIQLTEINPQTGLLMNPGEPDLNTLAARPVWPHAVEAPFMWRHNGWVYLFVSFDQCCEGVNSTYNVRVGRAPSVHGPFVDRDGRPLTRGGGTLLAEADGRFEGPGHNAVFHAQGRDYVALHAYDREYRGVATLRVHPIEWSEDGWPKLTAALEPQDLAALKPPFTKEP